MQKSASLFKGVQGLIGPWGSGCGSVGREVASDTRDPRFESTHRQIFIFKLYNRKDKNKEKEKEAGNGPSLKKGLIGPTTDNKV